MGLKWTAKFFHGAYAALFVVFLPMLLVVWARALDARLSLPTWHDARAGLALGAVGLVIWAAGVFEIVRRGGGLPLNAAPPPRLVTTGIYRVLAHPLYFGWVLATFGVALAAGSPSGVFVVTPVLALGCFSLVLGLERPQLRKRFGDAAAFRTWLSLPPCNPSTPAWPERLAVCVLLIPTWSLIQAAFFALAGVERQSSAPGAAAIAIAAFLAPTRRALRAFGIAGIVAIGLLSTLALCLHVDTWPAFALVWVGVAARSVAGRSRVWAIAAWIAAAAVVVLLLHGGSSLTGVALAGVLVAVLQRPWKTWRWALDRAERLANSWRAYRVGPLRIISHGVYPGFAAATALAGITVLASPAVLGPALLVSAAVLVGAGLWAQCVEGSPRLQRPFGYYGGILGGILASVALILLGAPGALVLTATAVMTPWIQAVGRLRCLVQGCCHGRPTAQENGIRVVNAHSRVVALSALAERPIHATQLYSIAGNVVIGLVLLRLWCLAAPIWFVGGVYLLLAGLARFAEEAYRGEAQTITVAGLPIYQYLAMASALAGVVVTMLGGEPAPALSGVTLPATLASIVVGVLYWFAMGVDFPEWDRRFARLSG